MNLKNNEMYFSEIIKLKLILWISILFYFSMNGQTQNIESERVKVIETLPKYPGGEKALIKYIQDNFRYPQVDRENRLTGLVIVKFEIDTSGQVINPKIIKGGTLTMNAEALRLVRGFKRFAPGTQKGKKVKTYYQIPFTFNLDDGQALDIRKVNIEKMIESGWGLDISLQSSWYSGGIQSYLERPIGFGVGVSFFKKRKMVDFKINYLFSRVKERFVYENLYWEKGRQGNLVELDVNGCYKIVRNNKLDITPFVGLSLMGYLPWKPVEFQPVKSMFGISGNAGLMFDFKRNYRSFSNGEYHHELIRVKISITSILFREGYKGSHFSIGVGYGLNTFKNK